MTVDYRVIQSKSNIFSGEPDTLWLPRKIKSNHGVLLSHGAAVPETFTSPNWPSTACLPAILARAGIPCVTGYLGTTGGVDQWANDTAMTRHTAAITYMGAQAGVSGTKAHLLGLSMGGGSVYRYAALNVAKVSSVCGLIPMANLPYMYANDVPSGLRAGVATAWTLTNRTVTIAITSGSAAFSIVAGTLSSADANAPMTGTGIPVGAVMAFVDSTHGTFKTADTGAAVNATATNGGLVATIYQPLPVSGSPSANLIGLAAAIATASIPNRIYYSSVDPYIRVADAQALATAAGGTSTAIDSTFGHTDGTIGEFGSISPGLYGDYISWILAHDS